ncbi:hypothetical protein PINS_up012589 [Pythium insidiosum]|nr:hypothetical protein PINS_up012589 [Pythium insidiosum]
MAIAQKRRHRAQRVVEGMERMLSALRWRRRKGPATDDAGDDTRRKPRRSLCPRRRRQQLREESEAEAHRRRRQLAMETDSEDDSMRDLWSELKDLEAKLCAVREARCQPPQRLTAATTTTNATTTTAAAAMAAASAPSVATAPVVCVPDATASTSAAAACDCPLRRPCGAPYTYSCPDSEPATTTTRSTNSPVSVQQPLPCATENRPPSPPQASKSGRCQGCIRTHILFKGIQPTERPSFDIRAWFT